MTRRQSDGIVAGEVGFARCGDGCAQAQRLRELGIRAALGARRVGLMRLVLREGLVVTGLGMVLGLLGAGLFTRLMQELLFGVTPLDTVTFVAAPVALVVTSLAACLGPALRAAAADPAMTLRGQ